MTSAIPEPAVSDRATAENETTPIDEIFGVYVVGSTMEPRYSPGDVVHVDPNARIRDDDDVLVEFNDGTGVIKQFVSRTPEIVCLSQLNPERELTYPMAEVKAIHCIVGCTFRTAADIDPGRHAGRASS